MNGNQKSKEDPTGDKSYSCDFCPKTFAKKDDAKIHQIKCVDSIQEEVEGISKEQTTTTKEMVSVEAAPLGMAQSKNVKKELDEEEHFSSSNLNQNDEENSDQ